MKILYDLIIPIFLVAFISLIFTKKIKKNPMFFYGIASIICLISTIYEINKIIVDGDKLRGTLYYLERMSLKGFLALAFFLLVMFCGAMEQKWTITKKLRSIRGEMAILGCILMIPHFIVYITKFIIKFIGPKEITALNYIYVLLGFLAFLILIPLGVTSIKKVRKKISPLTWIKIQKWSYLFFLLVYMHIVIILASAKEFNLSKFILYSVIFLGYTALKIHGSNLKLSKKALPTDSFALS